MRTSGERKAPDYKRREENTEINKIEVDDHDSWVWEAEGNKWATKIWKWAMSNEQVDKSNVF